MLLCVYNIWYDMIILYDNINIRTIKQENIDVSLIHDVFIVFPTWIQVNN